MLLYKIEVKLARTYFLDYTTIDDTKQYRSKKNMEKLKSPSFTEAVGP